MSYPIPGLGAVTLILLIFATGVVASNLLGGRLVKASEAALLRIPYGETRTYGDLARRLGREGAARAIGTASGANPLPLLIPCHRVVAADGLGGYSGGPALKRRLLTLEGVA